MKKTSKDFLKWLKRNEPEQFKKELKEYPKRCKECGDIIETSDDDARFSSTCYKCY